MNRGVNSVPCDSVIVILKVRSGQTGGFRATSCSCLASRQAARDGAICEADPRMTVQTCTPATVAPGGTQ